jgi:hypothetical protein
MTMGEEKRKKNVTQKAKSDGSRKDGRHTDAALVVLVSFTIHS